MSDTSQGPGWWVASDGKWYPPETWTGLPPGPPASAAPAAGPAAGGTGAPDPTDAGTPVPTQPPLAYGAPPQQYGVTPPPYGSAPMQYQAGPPNNGLAVASLVCACAGIIPFLVGIPCILGIIFGFVSRSQIKKSNGAQGGAGLALAGIIVGFGLIGIFVIIVIAVAATGGFDTCTSVGSGFACN